MSLSRIISILAALGAACSGVATIAGSIDAQTGSILMLAGTFITIFCERVQGGTSVSEDQ
jgi:hypothetical protein